MGRRIGFGVAIGALALGLWAWWLIDRPFGGATCWVNFEADAYGEALELEAVLGAQGLNVHVPSRKDGRAPARPVVSTEGGFWKTEGSLQAETTQALLDVGGGKFDQCATPSLID